MTMDTDLTGRVVALETALGVVDPAEQQERERQREAQRAEFVKRTAALKSELKANMAADLEDDRQTDMHLRAAAAAIGRRLARARSNAKICHELTVKPAPVSVGVTEVARRRAYWISAIFATIPDHRHRLAHLEWVPGHSNADTDFLQVESRLHANHVEPIVE